MKLTIEPQSYHFLGIADELNVPNVIIRPNQDDKPYGHIRVLLAGPDCKIVKPGDRVCCLPSNTIGMEHPDHGTVFIIPDSAVFAKYVVEENA